MDSMTLHKRAITGCLGRIIGVDLATAARFWGGISFSTYVCFQTETLFITRGESPIDLSVAVKSTGFRIQQRYDEEANYDKQGACRQRT